MSGGFKSTLVTRNVRVGDRRTSIRLEPPFWDLLDETSRREGLTPHDICTRIARRAIHNGLTGAIRIFLLCYAWTRSFETALAAVPTGRLPQRPDDGFSPD